MLTKKHLKINSYIVKIMEQNTLADFEGVWGHEGAAFPPKIFED